VDDVYERLADALHRLANGFPRTTAGVEIRLLQKMFSGEEATVAAALTATPQTSAMVAERSGVVPGRARALLKSLAGHQLVWLATTPGWRGYRLAPFVVGSYEAHMLATRDPEFAALVEEYLTSGGAVGMMAPQPAIHRTLPAGAAVKEEWVLPYDDVRQLLLGADSFRLEDCVCRVQQEQLDQRRCDFPIATCLWFARGEPSAAQGTITRAEALAFLDHAEEIGLVHTVSNVMEGAGYVCNCCGCCCGLLRGITEWGIEHSVAQANYFATIDADACSNCGTCVGRCQVRAISEADDGPVIDLARCIGCGLCVTGCGQDAVHLQLKPQDKVVVPPIDFAAWERERLRSRGLL
jgi:Pyruvate/2-oxoacid:ferredoxin oxidoreductase delta subunit